MQDLLAHTVQPLPQSLSFLSCLLFGDYKCLSKFFILEYFYDFSLLFDRYRRFFLTSFFFKYLISLLVETTTDEFHTRLQCSVFAAISKEVNSRVPALPALLAPKYLGKHSRNYENIMYFHPTFDVEAGKNCQLAERLTRTFAYASNEQFHFIRPRGLPQLR